MRANRPVLAGDIQPAVETHRRGAARANRQVHILPAFVGHPQGVLERHLAIGRRARQRQGVGPHRVHRQIPVVRSSGTPAQVQIPRRVHLPGAPRRVQVAAEGQVPGHVQLRGASQRQVHIRQGLPMVRPHRQIAHIELRPVGQADRGNGVIIVRSHAVVGPGKGHRMVPVNVQRARRGVAPRHIQRAVVAHRRRAGRSHRQRGGVVVVGGHVQAVLERQLAVARRAGQAKIRVREGALIEPEIARHIQLRRGVHIERRDGVVRLADVLLPVVTGIQAATGVQYRPTGHVQSAQRLIAAVPVGAVRCHIDG